KVYQDRYRPRYTVIHSTVPVGTSRQCNAIHSPVMGIHPWLEMSLRTFVKFLGGEQASEVADYFRKSGMKVWLTDKPETTEYMKLRSTELYALLNEHNKDVKMDCDKYQIPYEMWNIWTREYNRGYQVLGYPEYTRPTLVPIMTKLGGHCLLPNLELLETRFSKFIKSLNETKCGSKTESKKSTTKK
ncbi:MAG: hypothetical protein ABIJ26_02135, partial [Candidatus Margulisiibacteriota bacterium]